MTPQEVIKLYGSGNGARAAKRLGLTRQAIYRWVKIGYVPPNWQIWIEKQGLGGLKAKARPRQQFGRKRNPQPAAPTP